MRKKRVRANSTCVNAAIHGFALLGDWEKALEILGSMERAYGVVPDSVGAGVVMLVTGGWCFVTFRVALVEEVLKYDSVVACIIVFWSTRYVGMYFVLSVSPFFLGFWLDLPTGPTLSYPFCRLSLPQSTRSIATVLYFAHYPAAELAHHLYDTQGRHTGTQKVSHKQKHKHVVTHASRTEP